MILDQLLTPFDASRILAIRPSRVERLARTGTLPHIEIDGEIRFSEEDVAEFVRSSRVPQIPVFEPRS